jgi:hypothetical protein
MKLSKYIAFREFFKHPGTGYILGFVDADQARRAYAAYKAAGAYRKYWCDYAKAPWKGSEEMIVNKIIEGLSEIPSHRKEVVRRYYA